MKKTLLLLSTVISSLTFAQDCSDLFISEYAEGWSNNKALEIYNPTASAIDLSQYIVVRYSNGATTADEFNAIQLTGTVAAYDVYVATLEKLDPAGTGQEAPIWDSLQDRTDGFYCPDYATSNAFYFNGNDAVVLAKGIVTDVPNSIAVDIFGKIGENPGSGSDPLGGWTADFPYVQSGDGVTVDHSMIRKFGVLHGETNPTISYFDPLLEYDSIPAVVDIGGILYGNWFSLGEHDCGCNPLGVEENVAALPVTIYPNPSTGVFFINNANTYTTIEVVNALGQNVMSIANNSKTVVTVNLNDHRGVYFVKLSDNNGNTVTKRVIVK